jgi:hypothetical protein
MRWKKQALELFILNSAIPVCRFSLCRLLEAHSSLDAVQRAKKPARESARAPMCGILGRGKTISMASYRISTGHGHP